MFLYEVNWSNPSRSSMLIVGKDFNEVIEKINKTYPYEDANNSIQSIILQKTNII